ncbi:hypothetical protein EMIHUDRAFT_204634 [Emiliania huxleyi CCMP1516]|uniref:Uncharacterized protein n=2 Tax=Emiliania huxleyi TaxID=2903 RepID=A0A0D3JW17_EMIH1|nr:hypothetical protein EMIHUDRAFT_204634 [Emiliania huxleyi CCMP1516]EOD27702.1 hypothetical protein EMIHUDRAFT_204634 [Emiliania huxleyi CCMP1516]|eukprot:XP_005780131.1 hypothetical protein EMIHUDRAFT_204634 [Emiliania huxleyi CCMP1516]
MWDSERLAHLKEDLNNRGVFSSFIIHHTQQISMAAVAGDADNINKQARMVPTIAVVGSLVMPKLGPVP